ncbi:phosphotransferase system, glucose-specific EI/HPr/EIIA component [Pseudomonas fragi]|uniref:PTS system glucose-specific EIIA component n=1 Tax=Pseudomonas fragi TaxID=296 RepID=A0A449IP07_PSEFR|nr:phosphotransferase system, glucose-specific EI/HPr/EIIA component [Pseudomonas fragi]
MVTSQQVELLAPLSGVLMALDNVPDPVFASRLIGDGLCIDPTSQVLCAPLAGVISNLQHTGHAISITHANGVQVFCILVWIPSTWAAKALRRWSRRASR